MITRVVFCEECKIAFLVSDERFANPEWDPKPEGGIAYIRAKCRSGEWTNAAVMFRYVQ